ncbi:hypothetical protein ACTFIY_010538 [Dictyostelium cf. discoideum]
MNAEFFQIPNNKKNLKRAHDDSDEVFLNKKNNNSLKEFSTDVVFQDFQVNNYNYNQTQQQNFYSMGSIQTHIPSIVIPNPSISKPPQLINQNNINIQSSTPNNNITNNLSDIPGSTLRPTVLPIKTELPSKVQIIQLVTPKVKFLVHLCRHLDLNPMELNLNW